MTRPTTGPGWATDSNFNDPGESWDGTPTRVTPSSGERAAGQLPGVGVPAQIMNYLWGNHGEWADYLDAQLHKNGYRAKDDFDGSIVDTGSWITTGSGLTTVNDHAAGGFGAMQMAATNGDATQTIEKRTLPIGTNNFRLEIRARYTVLNTGGAFFFSLSQAGINAIFRSTNSALSGRWSFEHGGVPTVVDTGISPSTTYQKFVIERVGGTLTASIDGTQVFSGTQSDDMTGATLQISTTRSTADATLRIDYVALTVDTSR
jgi:hypothetical protein